MEVNLNFRKDGSQFVAEAVARSNFAVHLQRTMKGSVSIAVRSCSEGDYGDERQFHYPTEGETVDNDFGYHCISEDCPKYIKLISMVPVTVGTLIGEDVGL